MEPLSSGLAKLGSQISNSTANLKVKKEQIDQKQNSFTYKLLRVLSLSLYNPLKNEKIELKTDIKAVKMEIQQKLPALKEEVLQLLASKVISPEESKMVAHLKLIRESAVSLQALGINEDGENNTATIQDLNKILFLFTHKEALSLEVEEASVGEKEMAKPPLSEELPRKEVIPDESRESDETSSTKEEKILSKAEVKINHFVNEVFDTEKSFLNKINTMIGMYTSLSIADKNDTVIREIKNLLPQVKKVVTEFNNELAKIQDEKEPLKKEEKLAKLYRSELFKEYSESVTTMLPFIEKNIHLTHANIFIEKFGGRNYNKEPGIIAWDNSNIILFAQRLPRHAMFAALMDDRHPGIKEEVEQVTKAAIGEKEKGT